MFSRRALASSSLRVGSSPERTLFASLPSAVLVFFGKFLSVCLLFAPDCAFFTFLRAAARCFSLGISVDYPRGLGANGGHSFGSRRPWVATRGAMATRFSASFPTGLRYEPTPKRVRADVNGTTVLDTTRAVLVWKPGESVPKYAAPADDVDIAVVDRLADGAAQRCADDDLRDYLLFEWDAFDRWREEEEEVVGHPRDPFHRVDIRRSSRHVRVALDGVKLAESRSPSLLFETGLPVRYYFAREDVDLERLEPSSTR